VHMLPPQPLPYASLIASQLGVLQPPAHLSANEAFIELEGVTKTEKLGVVSIRTPTTTNGACLRRFSNLLLSGGRFVITVLGYESRMHCHKDHEEHLFIALGPLGKSFQGHGDVTIIDKDISSLTLVLQGLAPPRNKECVVQ